MPFELFTTIGAILGLGAIEKARDKKVANAKMDDDFAYYMKDYGNTRQYDLVHTPFLQLRDIYLEHYGKDCPGMELAWSIGEMTEVRARVTIIKDCMMYGIMQAENNPIDRTGRKRCWYCNLHKYQCKWKEVKQLPITKNPYHKPEEYPIVNPKTYEDLLYNKWD